MLQTFINTMGINTKIIEEWWEVITLIGAAFFVASLFFDANYINMKHLAGLGFGLMITGISCWCSIKTVYKKVEGGMFTGKIVRFNSVTISLFIIGLLISAFFLALFLWKLI